MKKRLPLSVAVPVSSMADIAFLLLIFFMVTSVLKVDPDLPIVLPDGSGSELSDNSVVIAVAD